MKTFKTALFVMIAFGAQEGISAAADQAYPAKPVRVIAPFPASGGTDVMARTIAQKLSSTLGQQFVTDNRAGAGGMIGIASAVSAAADGYTLIITSSSPLVIGPNIARKPLYDPLEKLAPISLIGSSPNVLVVHPSLPARSVKELIAVARQRPGELNYASSGVGTLSHLTSELFMSLSGIRMTHVAYKGGPPSVLDLIAGQVSVTFSSFPALWPHVSAGRLRALAVTGAKRAALAPDLPALAETIPGFESSQWWGVFGPRGISADIIDKLNSGVQKSLTDDAVKGVLAANAAEAMGGSAEDCGNFLRADYEKWRKVIRRIGLQD